MCKLELFQVKFHIARKKVHKIWFAIRTCSVLRYNIITCLEFFRRFLRKYFLLEFSMRKFDLIYIFYREGLGGHQTLWSVFYSDVSRCVLGYVECAGWVAIIGPANSSQPKVRRYGWPTLLFRCYRMNTPRITRELHIVNDNKITNHLTGTR